MGRGGRQVGVELKSFPIFIGIAAAKERFGLLGTHPFKSIQL